MSTYREKWGESEALANRVRQTHKNVAVSDWKTAWHHFQLEEQSKNNTARYIKSHTDCDEINFKKIQLHPLL